MVLLLLSLLLPASAQDGRFQRGPQTVEEDEVDHVELAALLIGDGHWDRARRALDQVDVEDPELDAARYWTLRGLVELHDQNFSMAAPALREAIDAGAEDPRLYSHLARAMASQDPPDLYGAWDVLDEASARFPDEPLYDEQRILILVELGLYQEARDLGSRLQEARGLSVETQVVIAEAMKRGGQIQQGIIVLEQARLLAPDDPELPVHLARMYLADDMPLAAAQLLQVASLDRPELALEAAECYRRAGQIERALMMNAEVPDSVAKSRQRLGLLLEAEAWERAVALTPRLRRGGLLEEDEVAYGLAYAWFKVGDYEQAEAMLKRIQDPQVFKRAVGLRQAMETCVAAGGCL